MTPFPGLPLPRNSDGTMPTSAIPFRKAPPVGLLTRALLWFQTRRRLAGLPRRLKLCATVPLGEKRFVSIIECDGLQFLIGGGAENVSLLAQLNAVKVAAPTPIDCEHAQ